jgi:hypothetical protein
MTPESVLDAGWSIIPMGMSKKPLLSTWKEFQHRPPTQQELAAWSALNPPAWAVITGAISGRITLHFDGGNRDARCSDHLGSTRTEAPPPPAFGSPAPGQTGAEYE